MDALSAWWKDLNSAQWDNVKYIMTGLDQSLQSFRFPHEICNSWKIELCLKEPSRPTGGEKGWSGTSHLYPRLPENPKLPHSQFLKHPVTKTVAPANFVILILQNWNRLHGFRAWPVVHESHQCDKSFVFFCKLGVSCRTPCDNWPPNCKKNKKCRTDRL